MGLHLDGKAGQLRMKRMTVALLTLIQERSCLSAAQLEAKFGLGLQGEHDQETGQEWKRYSHPPLEDQPSDDKKNSQALSLSRLLGVSALASDLGYVTKADLWPLFGFHELEPAGAFQARFVNERQAVLIFQKGKARLADGKMPMTPGGAKGGAPRAARSSFEARLNYELWLDAIRSYGGEVFEDRNGSDVSDREMWLAQETGALYERRPLSNEEYQLLEDWERPFDPTRPNVFTIQRLRVRLSFGWVGQPWAPHHRASPPSRNELAAPLPATNAEIDAFFLQMESEIARSVRAADNDTHRDVLRVIGGAKAVQRARQTRENNGKPRKVKLL